LHSEAASRSHDHAVQACMTFGKFFLYFSKSVLVDRESFS